jgi:pyruvate dehydrogenase E1 component
VLAKTIKGYGMGSSGEAQNIAHQQKHLDLRAMRNFRDRFAIPVADDDLVNVPFYRPPDDSAEARYLADCTRRLGSVPQRRRRSKTTLAVPELSAFEAVLRSSGERELSTTMAFTRILSAMLKDKTIGARVVPIVADESRTFGMEGMFRQLGIYSHQGQLYKPQDSAQLMYYREDKSGQILQEGINEAGAMCSWIAAATSYSTSDEPMIPMYIFYSMFGFQRVGDLTWAAGDMRSRGFLLGGTAGRTTLNGEGLQHEDGQSQLHASFVPNCVSYDPTYAYELAVIVRDGLRRMLADQEDVYYYITVMNENYTHPEMPPDCEAGILRGAYLLRDGGPGDGPRVQLLGSGTILREVLAAGDLLAEYGVSADVWSATSFNELRRDGLAAERWNLLHPADEPRVPYLAEALGTRPAGPVVATSDYMKAFAGGVRPFVGARRFHALGTDGFGRSDYRRHLRDFFEVDRRWVALAALKALADDGALARERVGEALVAFGIDPAKPNPVTV